MRLPSLNLSTLTAPMLAAALVCVACLSAPAHADDLGKKLAKIVADNSSSLVTVTFTVNVANPMAGFMGGMGGRGGRGGGGGEGGDGEGGGGRRRGGGGGGDANQAMTESNVGVVLDAKGHVLITKFEAPSFMGMGGGSGPSEMKDIKVRFESGDEVEGTYVGQDAATGFVVVKVDPAGLKLNPIRLGGTATAGLGDPVVVLARLPKEMGGGAMFRATRINAVIEGAKNCLVTQETIDDLMGCPAFSENGEIVGFVGPYSGEKPAEAAAGGFNPRSIMRVLQGRGSGEFIARGVILPVPRVQTLLNDPGAVASTQAAAWHGLEVGTVSSAYRTLYGGLDEHPGCVTVKQVAKGSPAETAGIKAGDILLDVDGKAIDIQRDSDVGKFEALFAEKKSGDVVKMAGMRDGEPENFTLTLADAPPSWGQAPSEVSAELGLTVRELTGDYVKERRLPAGTQGVVVTEVKPETGAAKAGLQTGDVITKIADQDVVSLAIWKRSVATGLAMELTYLRGGKTSTATLAK